jgi:hypothetical protein
MVDGAQKKRRGSHIARGTCQVWVDQDLHFYIAKQAEIEGRTIKSCLERHAALSLGFENMVALKSAVATMRAEEPVEA